MQGASGGTQFRLHRGFHYPRSFSTREQVKKSWQEFRDRYPEFVFDVPWNIYAVDDSRSTLDYGTFAQIMDASHISFDEVDPTKLGLTNVSGAMIGGDMGLFVDTPRVWFQKQLEAELCLNTFVKEITTDEDGQHATINGEKFDWAINATYGHLAGLQEEVFYEPCVSLVYELQPGSSHPSALHGLT